MQTGNRFRAYPTPAQESILLQWIGHQRFIYNAKVSEDRYYRVFAQKSVSLSGKSGIEPGRGLFPPNRPVTEYLGGNLPEPGGVLSDEPGVLLIDGNGRSRKGDRFLGKDPVVPVLRDLRVVDEPLMSYPLEKDLLLGGGGIRAKAVADLHGNRIP